MTDIVFRLGLTLIAVVIVVMGFMVEPQADRVSIRWGKKLPVKEVEKTRGDVMLSMEKNERILTIDELKVIAEKGKSISWEDFKQYKSEEIGSGLYILGYYINKQYYVLVGGTGPDKAPWYVRLYNADTGRFIDVGQDNIDEFLLDSEAN